MAIYFCMHLPSIIPLPNPSLFSLLAWNDSADGPLDSTNIYGAPVTCQTLV